LHFLTSCERQDQQTAGDLASSQRKWDDKSQLRTFGHAKHRPWVAGGGDNLPLDIIRCLAEWVSVLDDRGAMTGA
jgi:ion channel-forming bestrophin family protein